MNRIAGLHRAAAVATAGALALFAPGTLAEDTGPRDAGGDHLQSVDAPPSRPHALAEAGIAAAPQPPGFAEAAPGAAPDIVSYETRLGFDEVVFALENALIGQGLEVEGQTHMGTLLAQAGESTGTVPVFRHAEVFSFCSAMLALRMVAADPLNLVYCPYTIFVAVRLDTPEITTVGYRGLPDGPLDEVERLLDTIALIAAGRG
jgi:uncharacterized protein (DUF302 family)